MSKVEPYVPPGDYQLLCIHDEHRTFVTVSSVAFTALFVERGIYAYLADGQRSGGVAAALILLSAIIVCIGFVASFVLPCRLMPEHDQKRWIPHTLDFLFGQLGIAVGCVVLSSTIALILYGYLIYPNLLALAWLIRDGFIYIALGTLVYQGFVLFVRYLTFLYQTGGSDKTKVIAFEAGAIGFVFVFGLFLYTIDLFQMLRATSAQGLLAMHLTVRDILMAVIVGIVLVWQMGRVGDH